MKRRTEKNRKKIVTWICDLHSLAAKISSEIENIDGPDSKAAITIGNIMCDADQGLADLDEEWPEV